ncbi:putative S-adenosylmethionine-dependent methyltransferase [Melia azedarach]|uniref:S-adenosylmethionine-dependent methyltransferase n=1 Tax=Melia azedarach TaxID=155640 RepID=A0ACC1WQK6_MELAZ|nr:putative S-adenosylmethionine-dependent methyltransferase [Melia azedarach]
MATVTSSNFFSVFLSSRLGNSRRCFFQPNSLPILRQTFAEKVRASSTAFVETKPTEPIVVDKEVRTSKNVLACPICYQPMTWIGDSVLSVDSAAGSSLQCNTCKKTYSGQETHFDLTAASGTKGYGESMPPATEFFRIPLISFLYERGWRQNFVLGGFPGPEKEFELMKDYLKPVLGGNIIDASCGSGLFARIFAKSGLFSLVVALDYSENMLKQCYEFVKQEQNFPKENLILARADISRLPFVSSSIDAVHAGAAIHCWPSPSTGVAEISRVLRPGGVFVGTTYILDGPFNLIPFSRLLRQSMMQISGSYAFLAEEEIEDLCRACGLVDFKCIRNSRFVMFTATKPN